MCLLLLYCLIILSLGNIICQAEIPCLQQTSLQKFNRSIDFSLTSKRNQTGHWITSFSVDKAAPTLPTNLKVQVKQSVTEFAGIQSFHLNGVIIVPPTIPADYELFPGIGYYKFHTENAAGFDDAMIQCAREGGHLAIINSDAESQVLQKIYARYPQSGKIKSDWAYIGFHDRYKEGEHVTIFGVPINSTGYTRWLPNQPDNAGAGENCGSIHRNGGINDLRCVRETPYFCEFDLSWANM